MNYNTYNYYNTWGCPVSLRSIPISEPAMMAQWLSHQLMGW